MSVYKSDTSTPGQRKAARERLLRANLRYVFKTAKNYSKNYPSQFEDLISAGNEGLIVGLDKYDITSGNRFLTYAGWWVLQRILKEMSKLRLVSLPIWKQQVAAKILKMKEAGEEVTLEGLREAFPKVADKDLRELSETQFLTCHLDDISDGTDLLPVDSEIEETLDNDKLHARLLKLPEPQRTVLMMSFGMDDGKEKNVRAVAKEMGMDKNDVARLKKEGLEMLREEYL